MDDVGGQPCQANGPGNLRRVLADGIGQLLDVGELAFINELLPTEAAHQRLAQTFGNICRFRSKDTLSSCLASQNNGNGDFQVAIVKNFHQRFHYSVFSC